MAKVALLIGVSEYPNGLNPLPAAVKDVEAIRRVLVNPEMGGFADGDITVLKDPQPQEIRDAIFYLFANRQKDDLLLFYFSGHGIKDDRGNLYFSTRATRKYNGKLVKPSAVAASVLHESINDSRSQRQVIILDCCFSGAIAQGMRVKGDGSVNVQAQLGGKGRAILTSSTSTQYSFEQEGSELSIYTRYLVEGIDTGVADKDGDGWISVDELHEYARSKVQEASPAMTPKFYPVEEGHKILLAKSPQDDPRVIYRQEVECRAQENQGNLSVIALKILELKRNELNISQSEATAIQEEVLQPYREYERKRHEYEQALIEAANQQYPFSPAIQKEIRDYQQYLGLRDQDIAAIEQRILATKQVEYELQQQEAERLKQEQEKVKYQEQIRQQQVEKQREQEEFQRLQRQREQNEAERKRQGYENNLRYYKQDFLEVVTAQYPLDEIVRNELKYLQQSLELTDEDIAQIEKPILDKKEIEYQEQLRQQQEVKKKRQEHENKLWRYQQELLTAVQAQYPLNDFSRNQLDSFQKFLGLSAEEVAYIEKPILVNEEIEYQKRLQKQKNVNYQRTKQTASQPTPKAEQSDENATVIIIAIVTIAVASVIHSINLSYTNNLSTPSSKPTFTPSSKPTFTPFSKPTSKPSSKPTSKPSSKPTSKPSSKPTSKPSSKPTSKPSSKPSSEEFRYEELFEWKPNDNQSKPAY